MHDHWASYFKVKGVLYAMCNAHDLRELEALAELDGAAWTQAMQQLLRRANRAAWIARERIERRYDQLLREALAHHEALPAFPSGRQGRMKRRRGHDLALRLSGGRRCSAF